MTIELHCAVDHLVPICHAIAERHANAPKEIRRQLRMTLRYLVRHCEFYVEPLVSCAAYRRAERLEIVLHDMAYRHQDKWDKGHEIFHWEHVYPAADITKRILDLKSPTDEDIKSLLSTSMVAWILKTENSRLRSYKREDPLADYAAAGIKFVDREGKAFDPRR